MTLLAAFKGLLYRYTAQRDLLVGVPTTGRARAGFTGMVGYFVNPVVLRSNLRGNLSFAALLDQVRGHALGAFEHQDYPFPVLVEELQPERDPSRSPLFQVMFVLQKAPLIKGQDLTPFALNEGGARLTVGGLPLVSMAVEERIAQFDLTLTMAGERGRPGRRLQLQLRPLRRRRRSSAWRGTSRACSPASPPTPRAGSPTCRCSPRPSATGCWSPGTTPAPTTRRRR